VPDLLGADAERLRELGVDPEPVERAARAVIATLLSGGQLLTLGNGGSAADAQHVAAELVGRFEAEREGWPAIALTTDSSALTAIGNDLGFDRVFARQIEALGRPGDVVLAISTSGTSANVLAAARAARRGGLTVVGLCGRSESALGAEAQIEIAVPGDTAASVQERHLVVEHCLCRAVEQGMLAAAGADARSGSLPAGSVVTLDRLLALRAGWRAAGRVVVWTNGVFDLVHRGHLHSLEAARALGDVLVVGINSDASVRRLKGPDRPLIAERERAELLAALRVVDYVTVFEEDTPEAVLAALQPDVHTKGADYAGPDGKPVPERALVEAYGGRVEFLPLLPERSTTRLVAALRDGDRPEAPR
jgi:rfaE bifunctional protein nucleotidyltransferase chain/domain